MSFVNTMFTFISSFLSAGLVPTSETSLFSVVSSGLFGGLWEGVCTVLYWICKWFLAFMDFLQYFIQKLIGLDYWLKPGNRTLAGATEEDILFKFLYAESVENVFRALTAVFIILLIVITIYAIIKSEWTFMTGDGKGGNSKGTIFTSALKAVALVLVFPIVLTMGIISSNTILASIINAVGVDMASTFGGMMFSIASQTNSV